MDRKYTGKNLAIIKERRNSQNGRRKVKFTSFHKPREEKIFKGEKEVKKYKCQ